MLKIKYYVDSCSDIDEQYAAENDIGMFAIPVTFEDGSTYLDWVELKSRDFYRKLAQSRDIPKTSQPSVEQFAQAMRDSLSDYDAFIYISLSSRGSGAYQTALLAKSMVLEEHPEAQIEIIDSMGFSLFIVAMLMEAIQLQKEGKSLSEIVAGAKRRRCYTDVLVVVDTLKYLEKGGRINKASLIAGTLLNLKPVLSVRGGLIEAIDKFKGSKTVIPKMVKKLADMDIDAADPHFFIVNADVEDRAQQLWEAVSQAYPGHDLIMSRPIGATVGTHIGPGTLAVFFKTNTPQQLYDD